MTSTEKTKCGVIAILGRPNVGKSTLMNKILGQKISITSRKQQTTRHQILGIKTEGKNQAIFFDTPGIHKKETTALNRYMNKVAINTIRDADLILFLVEALKLTELEDYIINLLQQSKSKIILVVNKIDLVKNKKSLPQFIEKITEKLPKIKNIIKISAKHNLEIKSLENLIFDNLPQNDFLYGEEEITNRPLRFLVSEIIREKLVRFLAQELPYQITVEIINYKFDEIKKITNISANILVERTSQKGIVIGKQGQTLKKISTEARLDIEHLIQTKVFLQVWVRVKESWSNNEKALLNLGYN